jgi:hypothetical protein
MSIEADMESERDCEGDFYCVEGKLGTEETGLIGLRVAGRIQSWLGSGYSPIEALCIEASSETMCSSLLWHGERVCG